METIITGIVTLVGVLIANSKSQAVIEEQIKVANHRIDDLEHTHLKGE